MRLLQRFRRAKKFSSSESEGCGYWVVASLASLLMLCVNLAIVQIAYVAITPLWSVLQNPRVAQATVLIAPALLVIIEWWLWETMVDSFVREKPGSDKRRVRSGRRD